MSLSLYSKLLVGWDDGVVGKWDLSKYTVNLVLCYTLIVNHLSVR